MQQAAVSLTRTTLRRRELLKASLGAGASLACAGTLRAQAARQKLRVCYQSASDYGLFWVARDKGWFSDAGLDIELSIFDSGPPQIEALVGNSVDVALLGTLPPLNAAFRKIAPLRIISACADAVGLFSIVGAPTITDIKGLRGKKVAVTGGTQFEFFLDKVLEAHGMKGSDVVKVDLQPLDGQAAFVSASVDAVVPLATSRYLIFENRKDAKLVFEAKQLPATTALSIYDIILTRQEVIDRHKAALARMLDVYHGKVTEYVTGASKDKAIDDLHRWQEQVAKAKTSRDAVKRQVEGYTFYDKRGARQLMTAGEMRKQLESQATFMIERGKLGGMPNLDELLSRSVIESL